MSGCLHVLLLCICSLTMAMGQGNATECEVSAFLDNLGLLTHRDAFFRSGFDEMQYIRRMKPVDFLNLVIANSRSLTLILTYRMDS